MSRNGEVAMDWGDGSYVFRIAFGQWAELQDKTGCGPAVLYARIQSGAWKAEDLREIIRIGLIGGGLEPVKATHAVRDYVEARPLYESVAPALAILGAAVFGPPGEAWPGKDEPGEAVSESFPTEGSTSPGSTEQPQ